MSNRNLRSQHTLSDPAVPSALNPSTRIESEGPSRAPSPKGQGYESALSEPEEAESVGCRDIGGSDDGK
ncbi:hypothetical protein F5890DRAFT_1560405 [Lentinula detonsa]|uniref:Uncharacterized protein n=1 Tax=Lentinula detonsa TaxID=2804962 RepID=A0AA38UM55_9AGAR|nr:hypothetical protein F5890DRAFT_1560405 [Lentinula detonsa]